MEPVKTADGRVTVPEEVITSMERNKLGLKGEPSQHILQTCIEMLSCHVQGRLKLRLEKELYH